MTFSVIFRGLISHVQHEFKTDTTAVLIYDQHHTPVLVVSSEDLLRWHGDIPEPDQSGGLFSFSLERQHVRILGVRGILTRHVRGFDEHVPRLSSVLDDPDPRKNKVKQAVHDKEPREEVYAYFDYEDGTIEPLECYSTAVVFDPPHGDDPECLVMNTRYAVEMDSPSVKLELTHLDDGTRGWIEVRRDATIRVSNRAGEGNHFHMYREICTTRLIRIPTANGDKVCMDCTAFDKPSATRAPHDDHGSDHGSDQGKVVPMSAAGTVECTQSQFP